jgi:hypothetical protein
VQNDSDSSGNSVKISVKQQATIVTVNGVQAATKPLRAVNKPINSSIIFLGDCEMPITKSVARKNSASDSNAKTAKAEENHTRKIQIPARASGELKQQLAASGQQAR